MPVSSSTTSHPGVNCTSSTNSDFHAFIKPYTTNKGLARVILKLQITKFHKYITNNARNRANGASNWRMFLQHIPHAIRLR